jgi:hypothetical protein
MIECQKLKNFVYKTLIMFGTHLSLALFIACRDTTAFWIAPLFQNFYIFLFLIWTDKMDFIDKLNKAHRSNLLLPDSFNRPTFQRTRKVAKFQRSRRKMATKVCMARIRRHSRFARPSKHIARSNGKDLVRNICGNFLF